MSGQDNDGDGSADALGIEQTADSRHSIPREDESVTVDETPSSLTRGDSQYPPHQHPTRQQGATQTDVEQSVPPQDQVQNQPQPRQHDHQGQQAQQAQQGQYDQQAQQAHQGQQGRAHADAQTDDTGIVLSPSVARLGALTAAGYLAGAYVGIAPLGVAVLAWTLLEMELSDSKSD